MNRTPDHIPEPLADALIDQIDTGLTRYGGRGMRDDFRATLSPEEGEFYDAAVARKSHKRPR